MKILLVFYFQIANGYFCLSDSSFNHILESGYKAERHDLSSIDGYLLKVHRILPKTTTSVNKWPVLLMHGFLGTASDFLMAGSDTALGYFLANHGYDVWLGNIRGSKHSMKHKNYSSNSNEFWNFTWHEIGTIDLPLLIDKILAATKSSKLIYVGYSQGTTPLMILLSTFPKYNKKVSQVHLLAPTVFLEYFPHPLVPWLAGPIKEGLLNEFSYFDFTPAWKLATIYRDAYCRKNEKTSDFLCPGWVAIYNYFFGQNKNEHEVNTTIFKTLEQHMSMRASVMVIRHINQLNTSGKFKPFDYGTRENIRRYGTKQPKDYNLKNVVAEVYIYHATEDLVTSLKDVQHLCFELPSFKRLHVIPNYNHLDLVYARNARTRVYNLVLENFQDHKIRPKPVKN